MSCQKLQTYPVRYAEGDTLPTVGFRYSRSLAGLTFTLTLTQPDGTQIQRTHSNVDEANGIGEFTFISTDLVAGCNQTALIDLNNGAGGLQRIGKFYIDVDDAS